MIEVIRKISENKFAYGVIDDGKVIVEGVAETREDAKQMLKIALKLSLASSRLWDKAGN